MLDSKIKDYLNLNKTEGAIGVEVEMEMAEPVMFPETILKKWRVDQDGSLKGYGYELVLRKPEGRQAVENSVSLLKEGIAATGIPINKSIRAGVHVHLNMQENSVADIYRMMACYFPLETVLTRFCGDGREGNLFCLRAQDAEYMLDQAQKSLAANDLHLLRTNQLRYSAFNLQSLFTYGSLEFRALATKPELDNILPWVDILLALKKYTENIPSAWESIAQISGEGPREWMYKVFGKELGDLLDYPDLERDMMKDVRHVQMLCYQMTQAGV